MSLMEHSFFVMALQALALGIVYGLRGFPPRLSMWVCVCAICAFVLPWTQIGTGLGGLPLHNASTVFSAELFRDLRIDHMRTTADGQGLEELGIGLWLSIAAAWTAWTFLRAGMTLNRWRSTSSHADIPTGIVHQRLLATYASVELRRVQNSRVAMTSGLRRPTLWIGDDIDCADHLKTALNHELSHVNAGDQYLVVFLTLLERALWWNPLVWLLAAEARRQIEYACDQRCKHLLGEREYTYALAQLSLIKAGVPALPGALALQPRNGVITRMKKLSQNPVTRPTHLLTLAAFVGISAFASAVIAGENTPSEPTLMACEKAIPTSANWRMSIERDPEARTLSVSLEDLDAPDSDGIPDGSEPYMRCLFSALGIPQTERPTAT